MKLIDRYVVSETAGAFLFGLGIFSALLMAGDLLRQAIMLLVDKGAPGYLVVELFILRLPSVVVLTIPMATLLAMLLSFSRLSTQQEINAMRAGGVSFLRILAPALGVGLMASVLTILINEKIAPPSNLAADRILVAIGEKSLEHSAQGVLLRDPPRGEVKRVIFAQGYSRETKTFARITLIEYDRGEPVGLVSADSAKWTGKTWYFTNGYVQPLGPASEPIVVQSPRFRRSLGKDPEQVEREIQELQPNDMTLQQLLEYIEGLRRQVGMEKALLYALVEMHNKIAVPFSCLVFALVGAPLGLQPHRSSSSIGIGLSIVGIFLYYAVWYYSCLLGESGHLPPILASWSGNIVTAIVGVLLVMKASK